MQQHSLLALTHQATASILPEACCLDLTWHVLHQLSCLCGLRSMQLTAGEACQHAARHLMVVASWPTGRSSWLCLCHTTTATVVKQTLNALQLSCGLTPRRCTPSSAL
jgi:hypothetical protein